MAIVQFEPINFLWTVIILVGSKIIWELAFSPLRQFPGPLLAKFTNFYRATVAFRGHTDDSNRKWHARYGGAVRVGPNAISLADPSFIKTIFTTRDPWSKTDMYGVNETIVNGQRIPNVFSTQDEVWHDQQMKPIRPFYTTTRLLDQEPIIDETLGKLVAKLRKDYVDGPNAGKTCMMDDWAAWFSWDTMGNLTFGQHMGFIDQERDIGGLIKGSTLGHWYFSTICQLPWLDNFLDKNPFVRIGPGPVRSGVLYAYNAVAGYIKKVAERGEEESIVQTFMQKFHGLKKENPELVNDDQLVGWLLPNILAGGDTTASSIRAVIYHLAKSPDAYRKLQAELDEARVSVPAQWKDVKNLRYLDAVIREAMRICPGIALMLERFVPKGGFTLPDGRFIPKGTKVGINPAVTCYDRNTYGDNADQFVPERWLQGPDESDEAFAIRSRAMVDTLEFVFGAGSRVCTGKYLAKLEIYKLIPTLYSTFDIKLVDMKHEWKHYDYWFVFQYDMPMTISLRAPK